MKKKLYRVFVILQFIILLTALLIGSGCADPSRRETAEDCIPSEIGSPEGLWLYNRNLRMRTDGSESEEIITDIVSPSGNEYASQEWSIKAYKYITEAQKIIFVITTADETFLYGYDYKNKQEQALYDLPTKDVSISYANNRIYIKCNSLGLLYDYNFNLLSDEIIGDFSDGIVYMYTRYIDYHCFRWWANGIHTLNLPINPNGVEIRICGDYFYLFYYDAGIVAVNMYTEKFTRFDVFDTSFDPQTYSGARRMFENIYFNGTDLYVFSVIYKDLLKNPDESDWFYELHKITNDKAQLIYDFGSARWGAVMHVYENNLYFEVKHAGNLNIKYYCHNTKTGKTSLIPRSNYHTTPTTINRVDTKKIVGEYEFYITSVSWGYSGFMNAPEGYCYYLMRKHGKKKDIMQYSFKNTDFFDDICEF